MTPEVPVDEDGVTAHRDAVIDLLGVLMYAELRAFDRLAEDSRFAPTLDGRAKLAAMAAAEVGHYVALERRLRSMGVAPEDAMSPFTDAIDGFHNSTRPSNWYEGLVKAFVGDGFAADFYGEIATFVDASTRELVLSVLEDTGHADFAVREVRSAIDADPQLAGRLALWARRLVGEALTQAQQVIAERDNIADMVIDGAGDLQSIGALLKRISNAHGERMRALGLST
ncbi:tRNA-(MS[2]IO[6]A)-hydroxylase MiaE-like protein [Antricoccus suffuscus]|uniref:tRNA-(MS[2]IO[6]A)-hydroxylase MiaE-like protein n=1 Tax=Antricoccus suffuscus TaxID=1629062 RepID=A0A2T0ZQE4_9ACTN|nr:ferritin-like fold-containing protein [Antricoccus suffuscus]PRZ38560.1 tRNA-(MS[2]IO[6]A)-hydroxylase MiaE-like protein [Antricoccus suffuscus]